MVSPTSAAPPAVAGDDEHLRWLTRRSIEVIRHFQDPFGAYSACENFSAYRGYAWLRDGSFTAEAMSRWGQVKSATAFHQWVARVLTGKRGAVDELVAARATGQQLDLEQMLPTRFTLTGGDGDDEWWDFQTDGYGMWLWALATHLHRHQQPVEKWLPAVTVAVDYLCAFGGDPCFDWWEEHSEHRHVSTLAAVRAGLLAAAGLPGLDADRRTRAIEAAEALLHNILTEGVTGASKEQHLTKWIGSEAVDASLAACVVPFAVVPGDDPLAVATLAKVAADLDVDGGVHRFRADVFYGGGQWILLSCLLGWNAAATGDIDGAWRHLRWAAAQADFQGYLPEQVGHHLLHPQSEQEWVQRWGSVAKPLLWSHAMYLILADELGLQTVGDQQ